jgi:trk system potassium uptake protein TrkA
MSNEYKRIAVVGLGRFGFSLAVNLQRLGCDVIAIDSDINVVEDIKDSVSKAYVLDATDRRALEDAGVKEVDAACVSMGRDLQASVLAALLLREIGVKYIISTAMNELHRKILEKIGVDLVISPEKDMGARIAYRLMHPSVIERIEVSSDVDMIEVAPPHWVISKTLEELNLPETFGVRIFAIKRGENVIVELTGKTRILVGDKVYLYGKHRNLEDFIGS